MIIAWFWGIYFLTLLQLIHDACILNWHIPASWRWSIKRQKRSLLSPKRKPELIIFLPVLREQKLLSKTLQLLGNLPFPGKKRIIVVTTEREIAENHGERCGTTFELAKGIIAELQCQGQLRREPK